MSKSKSNKEDIQELLNSMGFHPNDIQRAFQIHEENNGDSGYNTERMTEIICRLQSDDKSTNQQNVKPFKPHMTMQQAMKLKVKDKVDHRDEPGRFVLSTVIEKQGTNLKIHYDGWSPKWDIWSDFSKEIHRFAVAGSISRRKSHRNAKLKVGYHVDINPAVRHPGWRVGKFRKFDLNKSDETQSGQVQVSYEGPDQIFFVFWTHLDNEAEIAEFGSISKAKLLMNGYIRKNDSRIPKELIALCFQYYGSTWTFNNNGECPTSRREKINDTLWTNYQQLQSLVHSIDDETVMRLSRKGIMRQIQNHHDETTRFIQKYQTDNVTINRKRTRSEFETASEPQKSIESDTEPQKKRRKLENQST